MAIKATKLLATRYHGDREPLVFGYLRVHDTDVAPDMQETALGKVEALFIDSTSAFQTAQPQLNQMLVQAQRGDVLRVATIDRLGVTISDAIQTLKLVTGMGIEVQFGDQRLICQPTSLERSTHEERDWLVLNHLAEADLTLRKNGHGFAGTIGGSAWAFDAPENTPPALSIEQLDLAEHQIAVGIPRQKVADGFRVSPATLFLAMHRHGEYADYPRR